MAAGSPSDNRPLLRIDTMSLNDFLLLFLAGFAAVIVPVVLLWVVLRWRRSMFRSKCGKSYRSFSVATVATEAEWLRCPDPGVMMRYLDAPPWWLHRMLRRQESRPRKLSDRKARLFATACCRRPRCYDHEECWRNALEVSERYADGLASNEELSEAKRVLPRLPDIWRTGDPTEGMVLSAERLLERDGSRVLRAVEMAALGVMEEKVMEVVKAHERAGTKWEGESKTFIDETLSAEASVQASLLREVAGNPFRPVSVEPAWLTPDVVQLAQRVYDAPASPSGHLDSGRVELLAESLQEAGCENRE